MKMASSQDECQSPEIANEPQTTGLPTPATFGNGEKHPGSDVNMSEYPVEPIAIVGMAMRLPGGIRTADAFWEFLVQKKDAKSNVPADRYNIDALYGVDKPMHIPIKEGYFLTDLELGDLDTSCFPMKTTELRALDPQQRLLLEIVWECLENAGQTKFRGQNVGCFIGSFGDDWQEIQWKDPQNTEPYRASGATDFFLANRISFEFGFTGPR